jgi:hypothetical protein
VILKQKLCAVLGKESRRETLWNDVSRELNFIVCYSTNSPWPFSLCSQWIFQFPSWDFPRIFWHFDFETFQLFQLTDATHGKSPKRFNIVPSKTSFSKNNFVHGSGDNGKQEIKITTEITQESFFSLKFNKMKISFVVKVLIKVQFRECIWDLHRKELE